MSARQLLLPVKRQGQIIKIADWPFIVPLNWTATFSGTWTRPFSHAWRQVISPRSQRKIQANDLDNKYPCDCNL